MFPPYVTPSSARRPPSRDHVINVEFLLNNSALPTATDADGRTPLDCARQCEARGVLAVFKAKGLLATGASMSA
jgi:hypothetical protein